MNDFTKEELEEIKSCLKYIIASGVAPYSCLTISLKKKTQSMIDNYCEHLWSDGSGNNVICVKCHKDDGKR